MNFVFCCLIISIFLSNTINGKIEPVKFFSDPMYILMQRPEKAYQSKNDDLQKLKEEVDKTYPFAANSYRYIFHFIDQIYELSIGNAFITFKNSQEIKDNLKNKAIIIEKLHDMYISSDNVLKRKFIMYCVSLDF